MQVAGGRLTTCILSESALLYPNSGEPVSGPLKNIKRPTLGGVFCLLKFRGAYV